MSDEKKTHYGRQKETQYIYFKINKTDEEKITKSQFTIYDFINNSSSFSHLKKEMIITLLESLKNSQKTFNQLIAETKAEKSTLYLLCLALQRSGLVSKDSRKKPFTLSTTFSTLLDRYSAWWRNWAKIK